MARVHDDIPIKFDRFNPDGVTREDILDENRAYVLHNLLTKEECDRIIAAAEEEGFDKLTGYDPSYRSNKRILLQSTSIVPEMERRVKLFMEQELEVTKESTTIHRHKLVDGKWEWYGLNPRLRICKYDPTNKFNKHLDTGYHVDPSTIRTIKTCMVYLNEEYDQGRTRFYVGHMVKTKKKGKKMFYQLKAKPGDCLIFNQNILHDGEIVRGGKKYMMRTDVYYKARLLYNRPDEKTQKAMAMYREYEELCEKLSQQDQEKMTEEDRDVYNTEFDRCNELVREAFRLQPEVDYFCT